MLMMFEHFKVITIYFCFILCVYMYISLVYRNLVLGIEVIPFYSFTVDIDCLIFE